MKNKILLSLLLIAVCFIGIYIYNSKINHANTIDVINKAGIKFEKMQIIFDSDNGNGNSKIDVSVNNRVIIPPKFEGSISLIIGLNGKTKKYVLKGYYGTYENKHIQCEINRKGNVYDLSNIYVQVE